MGYRRILAVIDVQNIYFEKGSPLRCRSADRALSNINQLINGAQRAGDQVVYFRHVHKKDQSDLGRMFDFTGVTEEPNFMEGTRDVEYRNGLAILPEAKHFIKNRYSAFTNRDFSQFLSDSAATTIAVCGFMTNYCCDSTTRDAHDLDLYVDFILDATGCPDIDRSIKEEQIKKVVGATLSGGFARVVSTKAYLKS